MKKTVVALALMFTLALAGTAQNAVNAKQKSHETGAKGDVTKTLLEIETKCAEAMKANDWTTVASHLDDKFIGNDESGVTDKAAWLKMMSSIKLSEGAVSDMKVKTFGDVAIVTGKFKGKGAAADGKETTLDVNWMDTWMKREGQWKLVATSSANVKTM